MTAPQTAGWRVPGRIEVIGKHTDYAGGNVLVCAVAQTVEAWATRSDEDTLTARTDALPDPVTLRAGVDAGLPAGHWGRYVQTVLDRLTGNFGNLGGIDLQVSSNLPLASGMSSSSALLCATALAICDLTDISASNLWDEVIGDDRLKLASYLACVENGKSFGPLAGHAGVGTLGGSEDHTAMLCSAPDELGQFTFAPVSLVRRVPWPHGWSFVVAVSGVAAEKTGAARDLYNRASLATTEALNLWNARTGQEHRTLMDAVRAAGSEAIGELLLDDPYLESRFAQCVNESERLVPMAANALATGDLSLFASVAAESQHFAEHLLGNQVPATSALVEDALALGAQAACSFGAGFGGSVWAMVPTSDAEAFGASWLERYARSFPDLNASTLVTRPSAAAIGL